MHVPIDDQDLSWQKQFQISRIEHWNKIAKKLDHWISWGDAYQKRLAEVYKFIVPPGQSVLELGCSTGDLLAALKPSYGVGIDFSPEMIKRAKDRHPGLSFVQCDAHEISLDQKFDAILLSDLLNDVWDVQKVLEQLGKLSKPNTRIIINSYSRLWQPLLELSARLGLSKPNLLQNWLTLEDIRGLLGLAGYETIRTWQEMLWPFQTPLLSGFCNRVLVKLWPFHHLALTHFIIARPIPCQEQSSHRPSVSVIVPARNEAGNIPQIFERLPPMGSKTEIVFVEGNSRDDTREVIRQEIAKHPDIDSQLVIQKGVGKGDAVRAGFEIASGEVLMILDADLTVLPEHLPRFYEAIVTGRGQFLNGVRLVYPMQKEAMNFANLIGNKFFSLAFSWLLGQPIKDTLCGTKVLYKQDYLKICIYRDYFGDFDPFGDFDLLFGAARLGLKIVDIPVRYHERTYGTTNISRWKHGWLLLRMVLVAARKLKMV